MSISPLAETYSDAIVSDGINLSTGPLSFNIVTSEVAIADALGTLYPEQSLGLTSTFSDFHVKLVAPSTLRRYIRPQLQFFCDGQSPFVPMPPRHGYAMLEWGMNWCISTYINNYLKLHAAVLEKGGRAVILPGSPGSGKSTLAAALMAKGWHLLSDELAMIRLSDGALEPMNRPVSLKNESIEVIRDFYPEAVMGPLCESTHKGTIAHVKNVTALSKDQSVKITPSWLIFPKFRPGTETKLTACPKGTAFMTAAENAFNYSLLGQRGFDAMSHFIDASDCYYFKYSDLNEAVDVFNSLA